MTLNLFISENLLLMFVKYLTLNLIEMENKREIALKKLAVFLINPGMFSLIVIGDRGVGKRFYIEKTIKELQETYKDKLEEKCLEGLNFVEAKSFCKNYDLNKLFEENEFKTLVIDDIDEINDELEKSLFQALSTTNGKFGYEKNISLRIIFTSNKPADELREDGKHLIGIMWDRISQLVIEFPSYKTDNSTIQKDFKETWRKMKFEALKDYEAFASFPANTKLQKFLEDKSPGFEGGFRDLDKLACLYFNYRIYHYKESRKIIEITENEIVKSVIDDFSTKTQIQTINDNELSVFRITENTLMKELERKFKKQVKAWSNFKYGSISKAEKALGLGQGTMKNWK
ncbi:hypothetical protein HNP99_003346 [Flavobacterium sp. 28A]|uniref:ATP-binding protein n=1 Tax=Flavobacterium sp. 28A TaxID=2735895 RepID=UPI00156E57E0|nr:ATP-binding protein [Flavobacterium sp. 28A]NRT16972.1 hypothetical protein [Flavobacterium sp. 28A]